MAPRNDALVYGENVTYHPVGGFPITASGEHPNAQVRARLRAIINHSHTGEGLASHQRRVEALNLWRELEEFERNGGTV
jgi:hypothetical protein